MSDKTCPKCGQPVDGSPETCPECAADLSSPKGEDLVAPPYAPYPRPETPKPSPDPFTAAIIPQGNPDSLWAYYLGLFSILPCFGLPMGFFAFEKGMRALKVVKKHPEAKGKTHAYVGIGCGSIGFLFNLAILIVVLYALTASKH